ncbi:uncharacterized protein FOMMEDRAFT_164233 [Fomitiporia mediterranea MF3/22]|uniref:uncharacterized protein n=1 Tax=Fomitiporia mediterranea (strain MF3/22) TaxID=694068 RepID=UPI0004407C44|nr:uncharacterized protein FOMMEDRAFT_164233 [Fomitiporia mediterranea MF3/22]EJD07194.1 hypothetical protein FOMMEDRAFT_164233 [Fomitiporia mediterranea MF3/22]
MQLTMSADFCVHVSLSLVFTAEQCRPESGCASRGTSLYPSREPTVKRLGLVRPDRICCAISVQRLRTLQQPGRGLDEGERSALLILSADEKFRACGSRYGWYALNSGFLPPTISAARLVIIRYGNHDYADDLYSQPVSEREGIFQLDTSSLRTQYIHPTEHRSTVDRNIEHFSQTALALSSPALKVTGSQSRFE